MCTEAAGLPHLSGPRQHSAGGASYVGGEGTRKTPFLSLTCAPVLVGVPFV